MREYRLHPTNDPAVIAEWEARHEAAIADSVLAGHCAHGSQMMGVVCRREHGHAGPHDNGEWQWGYDPLAPHVLRPLAAA